MRVILQTMNRKYFISTLFVTSLILFLASCTTSKEGDGSVSVIETECNTITVCHFNEVKDTISLNLSDLVKDFKIVRFENKEEAYFKPNMPSITDKYIGIRTSRHPFLLFDHSGKLLNEVGSVGVGPGEYIMLYDEVIKEKLGKIYLSPSGHSSKILEYNIDGSFVRDIVVKANLNKPKIDVADNGDITVIHMPFTSDKEKFLALQYDKDGNLKSELKPPHELLVQSRTPLGSPIGFNNEVFSFRNTSDLSFMITSFDTLFHYNKKENKVYPKFTIDFGGMTDIPGHIYSEIPDYYLTLFFGKGVIAVNKKKQTSNYIKIVNDFVGNMSASTFNFNKGWFHQTLEPSQLIEKIETRLAKSDCSAKDRKQLEELMNSLDENDNNIMFIGKLK